MRFHRVSMPKQLTSHHWSIYILALLTLACGILFQSTTVVREDQSSTTTLTVAMDKSLLQDASIAEGWQQQVAEMTAYMQQRGATTQTYDDAQYNGVQASISFPDLVSLNSRQSGEELSIFDSFSLKRWRAEFVFEAHTTSTLISQRILQITGLSESELLLVQFPLNISLQLPGDLIRSNANQIDVDGMQTWAIDWWFQEEHSLYASSSVPLIPPVITAPESGMRIKDASSGVNFAGTGEPGADIRLYRVEGDQRNLLSTGQIDIEGQWALPAVQIGAPGQYVIQVEEVTDHESAWSNQPNLEYRPLEPIVFVPGFYSCSEGLFQTNINWHWGLYPSNNPEWATTGLIPGATMLFYGPLLRYFLSQGYELNKNLFVACYNWTASLPEESAKLKDVLDWARYQNPAGLPLTVITHSNGGLVARYHIQNNPLRTVDQVSDLIMIAPPNHGAVKAYYGWEGGDISHEGGVIRLLTRLALARKCGAGLLSLDPRKVYDCLRYGGLVSPVPYDLITAPDNQIMSVAWFLPGCEYLGPQDCDFWTYPHAPPIDRLNNPQQIEALFQGIQGNVYILAGDTGDSTLAEIPFISPAPEDSPLWQYGKPDPNRAQIMKKGDDTVLLDSAFLPEAERFAGRYYPYPPYAGADHTGGIVKRPEVLSDLSKIIRENLPTGGETETEVSDLLIIWVESPVNLLVTDPNGQRIGSDAAGQLIGEIPDAAYGESDNALGPKFIIITNPQEGDYQFNLTGQAEGDYGLYGLSTTSDDPWIAENGHIQPGEVKTFTEPYYPSSGVSTSISSRGLWFIFCGAIGAVAFIRPLAKVNHLVLSSSRL